MPFKFICFLLLDTKAASLGKALKQNKIIIIFHKSVDCIYEFGVLVTMNSVFGLDEHGIFLGRK